MDNGNSLTVAAAEKAHRLGRERNLGNKHNCGLFVGKSSIDSLHNDLGFSRARNAEKQAAPCRIFFIEGLYFLVCDGLRGA